MFKTKLFAFIKIFNQFVKINKNNKSIKFIINGMIFMTNGIVFLVF